MKKSDMPTYIFFAGVYDYWKIANQDLYHNPDVFICEGTGFSFLDKINHIHNAKRWYNKKELPLKSIWYSLYSCASFFNKDMDQYIIFPENNPVSFSGKYLSYLRNKYPKLVMLFEFTNVCGKYNNLRKLSQVSDLYDHIITFNKTDSRQYGFLFQPLCYSLHKPEDSEFPYTDVLFVGRNKGRLPQLISIYDRLSQLGLKCTFFVTGVSSENQVPRSGIIYNRHMPYRDVLKRVNHANCILELLEDNNNYFSLRTFESLIYRKKLITTNLEILEAPFFTPSQMLHIKSPDDITGSFFAEPVVNDYDVSKFSPNSKLREYSKLRREKP